MSYTDRQHRMQAQEGAHYSDPPRKKKSGVQTERKHYAKNKRCLSMHSPQSGRVPLPAAQARRDRLCGRVAHLNVLGDKHMFAHQSATNASFVR